MKRIVDTEYLVLVVAVRRTERETPSSSSFPAAPVADEPKPGLAKSESRQSRFPFRKPAVSS